MTGLREQALESIAKNPWTAVVVSPAGELSEVVPFPAQPTPEAIVALAQRGAQGGAFKLVQQGTVTDAQLSEILDGLRGAQGYSRSRRLRPGINIPGREGELAALDSRQTRSLPLRIAWWLLGMLKAVASVFR